MGVPEPVYALNEHCSIIHDGTLYAYSPAGFQSLELKEGAEWKALPMDISLTGAECVKAVPEDGNEARLYIVGGSVNETAATWDYPGLMHYTFSQKKWDWVRSESWVTQNRRNHAAVYLNDSKSILVYSGSQSTTNAVPSSETFLISTVEPLTVRSSPALSAPPSIRPMMMPFDSSRALMVGGGESNTGVFTFGDGKGWEDLGVTLEEPITNPEAVRCTVVSGSDGSKVLERFDMSVAPNKVERIALLSKGGEVAEPGTTVGDKVKRVTVDDWPSYNSTYAPDTVRNGFSIAQDESALAVVTGGNEEDPLCMFNGQENAWVNATQLFSGEQVVIQSSPTSSGSGTATPTSSTPTASATSGAETSTPTAATPNNKDKMLTVLGATLGTIFGIAAILILILFCLKYRKAKNKKKQQSGYIEKDRMSFADRGAEFMSEAGGAVGSQYSMKNGSQTSLAIIGNSGHKRNMASDASTAGLVKKSSPLGYAEPLEMSKFDLKPEPIEERIVRQNSGRVPPAPKPVGRSRSSGWSRYFANNEATNLAQMPSDRSTFASERSSGVSQSMYSSSRSYSQPSQRVPPLDIPKFDGQHISRVPTGSPTLGNSQESLPHQAMQAELGRANSNGSSRSGASHDDYTKAPVETWTPVGEYDQRTSSAYTGSMVIEDPRREDTDSQYYNDGASSFYPKSNYSSFYPGQPKLGNFNPAEGRESTFTVFPGANTGNAPVHDEMPKSKFSSFYPAPPRIGQPVDRESTVTMFPGGSQEPPKREQQDMSWLNLGAGR